MVTIKTIWTTQRGTRYNKTTDEYQNWGEAHSQVLFSILRAVEKKAKIIVHNQDGWNADIEIIWKDVSCRMSMKTK